MDLCDSIKSDSTVEIITLDSDEGLEIMRHTVAAQVLGKQQKIFIQIHSLRLDQQFKTILL